MVNSLTQEQKYQRAQQIETAAFTLFEDQSFGDITMTAIASEAGVSKGTLFNYFESKESLFMTILLDGYHHYFDQLIVQVKQQPLTTVTDFLQFLLTETANLIDRHDLLVRLNALRGPILEHGANLSQTVTHRQSFYGASEDLATLIHQQVPSLDVAEISQLFIVQTAMISGMMNLSGLDEFNHQRLFDHDFEHFKIHLKPDTVATFRYYLQGKYPDAQLVKE